MKTRAIPIAMAALLLAGTCEPARASRAFGIPDCAEWLKSQTAERQAWLSGFLSGLNSDWDAAGKQPPNPLGALSDIKQAFIWMDNYCKSLPLNDVDDGGVDLFKELVKKQAAAAR